MKKILAMVLAMMLVLSMSVAFAAEEESTTTTTTSDQWVSAEATTTLYKDYTGATVFPVETLSFVSTANSANPTTANLTINNLTTSALNDNAITVNLPVYNKVGVYEYTITETAGDSQAVTYSTESIGVKVLVTYNYTDKCLDTEVYLTTVDGEGKLNTFTNTYKVGDLSVKKTISGNLASDTQYFKFTVTFNTTEGDYVNSDIAISATSYKDTNNNTNPTVIAKGWTGTKTVDFYLKANETITFSNIPAGVTYTVDEDDNHKATDATQSDSSKGYTVTGEQLTAETIVADTLASEIINNDKQTTITTGIALDNAPYMILMALVVIAGAALIVKRASANR